MLSEERIEEIKSISKHEDIYESLASALGQLVIISSWSVGYYVYFLVVVLSLLIGLHPSPSSNPHPIPFAHIPLTLAAPSIFENEDIKKGILMQLFGGSRKDFKANGRPEFRSDINILLCGDPATSKSQLLQLVVNLYTSHYPSRPHYTSH